jgi:ATP-dependent DNA helicase RecG
LDLYCGLCFQGRLPELIAAGEGQRVEFKSSFAEEKTALETLGGYLNAEGGHILFGVWNDGHVLGVEIGANRLENLAQKIERLVDPTPYPAIHPVALDTGRVVVISAEGRKPGIVYFVDGRAYVRVGRTTRRLSAEEVASRLRD